MESGVGRGDNAHGDFLNFGRIEHADVVVAADGVSAGDAESEVLVFGGEADLESSPSLARIGQFVHAMDFIISAFRSHAEISAV